MILDVSLSIKIFQGLEKFLKVSTSFSESLEWQSQQVKKFVTVVRFDLPMMLMIRWWWNRSLQKPPIINFLARFKHSDQIQFYPCSGRTFSLGTWLFWPRILLLQYLEPSQWSGEIAIFQPHIARNCYISPPYCFAGKRFCGVRIIGIGEPIMSAQEGGMMMGASQMDMRTNIMITCCMDSAYFNLMKWTRKT